MATITQDIRDSVQELAFKYCKECQDSCCNAVKNLISMDTDETSGLELFLEHDIPVFRSDQVDEKSLLNWVVYSHKSNGVIYTKEGVEIKKPALVEHFMHAFMPDNEIVWTTHKLFTVYADRYCPFYNENTGCSVHEDSRRPNICKEYPIDEIAITTEGKAGVIVARTCPIFTQQYVKEELRQSVSLKNPAVYIKI